jgi:predicted acyltransferase
MSRIQNERLLSLDLFRGITMFLLIAEGANLYNFFNAVSPENSIFSTVAVQFYHAEWHGMHFWDLIQPYFTFIIGVAMAFSLKKRQERGDSWGKIFNHILFRSSVLFALGIMLQSVYREQFVWELWNILTQLAVSIFITFLIFRFPDRTQLAVSLCLLIITEILYRYTAITGFDQPFVKDHNFGTFIDMVLMGKTHPDGWVAFNCIPTTAHMIWGVLVGNLMKSSRKTGQKMRILSLCALVCLAAGYGLDWLGVSPINKKISTSSFVLASGGWSLTLFACLYWLTDIKGLRRGTIFFTVVGMNPIFIYLFSRTIGRSFVNDFAPVLKEGLVRWVSLSEGIANLTVYLTVLGIEWYICYWLYKRKIFIKL